MATDTITQHSNHVTNSTRAWRKFTTRDEAVTAMAFDIHNRRNTMLGVPAESGPCKVCREIAEGLFDMGYRRLEP